jgi:glycerol-3-phosphate cytidylyltransferase
LIRGFTCGAFDLLHPGHVHLLSSASQQCDELYVGLHTDPTIDRPNKNKPIQTTFERFVQLNALSFVKKIIPYDTEQDLLNMLSTMLIHRRFLGFDYVRSYANITGDAICQGRNIEIVYVPRMHDWSSSELRKRIISNDQA